MFDAEWCQDISDETEERLHQVLKSFQTAFIEGKSADPRSEVA